MSDEKVSSKDASASQPPQGGKVDLPLPTAVRASLPKDLTWHEETSNVQRGSRPGDRYIRLSNPPAEAKRAEPNYLQLSEAEAANQDLWHTFKRFLIGHPLATNQASNERLGRLQALAILSGDALSSVAYGTELILFQLILIERSSRPEQYVLPISAVIALLIVIVATSYRQTIFAYPSGGGSYIVARENLGVNMGLLAAAALMIDYILNVAVAVSSGVAQFVSAIPVLQDYTVPIAVALIVLLTIGNLRGVRESGVLFSLPTYLFILSFLGMLLVGFILYFTGNLKPVPITTDNTSLPGFATQTISAWLLLQGFAAGCTALTGVEAISNGVPIFKKPESRNAATTLVWMTAILTVFFLGTSFLADRLDILPSQNVTVIARLAGGVFGDGSILYLLVTFSTTLILVLAANTSFADFPRLASLLARDKFLPNVFSHRGDRLAFSGGIVVLGIVAIVLVVIFKGRVEALGPLFAIGAFTAFTLSQAGMVIHWRRNPGPGVRTKLFINGFGATVTGLVLIILALTKFLEGAYLVLFLIPLVFGLFKIIYRHYNGVAQQISLPDQPTAVGKVLEKQVISDTQPHRLVVPVGDLNKVTLGTLNFARNLSDNVTALHISDDKEEIRHLQLKWDQWDCEVPLVVLESPYRSVVSPLLIYVASLKRRHPDEVIIVVLPEFVARHWWEQLLHNQTAFRIKAALLFYRGVVVISVPYQLDRDDRLKKA